MGKRILSLLLSIVMILSLAPTTFAASETENISIVSSKGTSFSAKADDTFTVTLSNNAMTISSVAAGINFDKEKLEVTEISGYTGSTNPNKIIGLLDEYDEYTYPTAFTSKDEANSQGVVSATFAGTVDTEYKAANIFTATFKVKSGVSGETKITMFENSAGASGYKADPIQTGAITVNIVIPVTALDITEATATTYVGETVQLTFTKTPAEATSEIEWTSSDTGIAMVDSTGKVSGVAAGTVSITAKSKDNGDVKDTCIVTVDACNHNYGDLIPEVPATCLETGTAAHYECSKCHKLFTEEEVETTEQALTIPKLSHNGVKQDGKTATCTEDGWKDYYHCDKGCNGNYEDVECTKLIENLDAWKTGAGKTQVAHGTNNNDKKFGNPATCTEDGVKDYFQCDGCNGYFYYDTENGNAIVKIDDLTAWKAGAGKIAATNHANAKKTTQDGPTCTEDGVKAYWYCEDCGTYFADSEGVRGDAIGDEDAFNAWKANNGKIAATNHGNKQKTAQVDSTCTKNGVKAYWYCADCETYFEDNEGVRGTEIENFDAWKVNAGKIAAKGHTQSQTYPGQAPSCVADGWNAYYHCDDCEKDWFIDGAGRQCIFEGDLDAWKASASGKINKIAHNGVKQNGQPADCTTPGWKDYYQCDKGCNGYYEDAECKKPIQNLDAWKAGAGKLTAAHGPGDTPENAVAEVPATCEANGVKAYFKCGGCGLYFYDNNGVITEIGASEEAVNSWKTGDGKIAELGHKYGTPTYTWSDNDTKCTASVICKNDEKHIITEEVLAIYSMDTAPTCTEAETGHYTATFTDSHFAVQTKTHNEKNPALGHDYAGQTVTYTWNDNKTECTASVACEHDGCEIPKTEKATVTYVEDTPATCTEPSKGHYKATFTDSQFEEQNTVANSATNGTANGHAYGTASYVWDGDFCTATATCPNCGEGVTGHTLTETKKATYVKDTSATCVKAETGHYAVTFTNSALGNTTTEIGSLTVGTAKGHSYGNPTYQWTDDSCTATRVCSACSEGTDGHTVSETKTGTYAKDTDATCVDPEKGHYTVVFDDTQFGNTQTTANSVPKGAAKGHAYGTASYVWNGDSCTATRVCSACTEGTDGHTISETKTGEYAKDTDATCLTAETGHYTVVFDDTQFGSTQTDANSATNGAAKGHTYGKVVYEWNGDSCTATKTCTACEEGTEGHILTETKVGEYVKDTDATCDKAETGHYEVEFTDTQFGSDQTDPDSVTKGDPLGHQIKYDAESSVAATCTTDGSNVYKCTRCDYSYTEKVAAHHTYGADGVCTVCHEGALTEEQVEKLNETVETIAVKQQSGEGNVESEVNTPVVEILNAVAGTDMPADIVERIANGETLEVNFAVSETTGAEKEKAEAIANSVAEEVIEGSEGGENGGEVTAFAPIEIDLSMILGENGEVDIHSLSEPIEIAVSASEDLKDFIEAAAAEGKVVEYFMVRIHGENGEEVTVLKAKYENGELIFDTDRLSTFVPMVVVSDAKEDDDEDEKHKFPYWFFGSGRRNDENDKETKPILKADSKEGETNPETGAPVFDFGAVAMILSAAAAIAVSKKRK